MGYEEERDRSGHRRSRRAKPSEMEDDGLTLITDSFTERREDPTGAEIEAEVVRKRQRGDRRSLAAAGRAGIRRKPGP